MSQKQIALFENLGLPQGAVAVNRRAWWRAVARLHLGIQHRGRVVDQYKK